MRHDARIGDREIVAAEVHGIAGPKPPEDLEELGRAAIPGGLVERVSEAQLLVGIPAHHDVQEQPPAGHTLEGRRHLRGERG